MKISKLLICEHSKHKRRYTMLIFFGVILTEMLFIYGNFQGKIGDSQGWKILFYNLPIMNSLFFPILFAAFASRLADIEHRGSMYKCLYCLDSPVKFFFTKFIYGLIYIGAFILSHFLSIVILAKALSFPLTITGPYLGFYLLNLAMSCTVLFYLHLIISYFISNQALSICIGIAGSFTGLFSAFLTPGIFHKILPWSNLISSSFIGMDWNRETRIVKWYVLGLNYEPLISCIVWIGILSIFVLFLLKKTETDEGIFIKPKPNCSVDDKVTIHKIPIEIIKLKGSPSWYAFFILPALSAFIGTLNYLANIEILRDGWNSLWTQHTLFLCYFFMPVTIALFCGSIWRIEHSGTNMNIILTNSSPAKIILNKYISSIFITTLSIIWIVTLYIFSGTLIHIEGAMPKKFISWIILGLIGAFSICAVQLFLSLIIRNFIVPIILSFLGGVAGLVFIVKLSPYLLPYSLFSFAMIVQENTVNIWLFIGSSLCFTVLFLLLSTLYLRQVDVN